MKRLAAPDTTRLLSSAALLIILVLAVFLRFANLRASPGWYTDEGVFVSYAANLAEGRWQIFSVQDAPMLIQRPPLFLLALAGVFRMVGADIFGLRLLTAFYGALSVGLLYLAVREMFDRKLALAAAGVLAIWPWAVAYHRLGFSYNQMAPLLIVVVYACWKFLNAGQIRWFVVACVAAGLVFGTDYVGVVAPALVALVLLWKGWRWLLPGLALMASVMALTLLPAYLANPAQFFADWFTPLSAKVGLSLLMQVVNLIVNYGELIRREAWVVLGLAGLFFLEPPRSRRLVLLLVGMTMLLAVRTFAPVGIGRHYLIHLYPWLALGIAALLLRAFAALRRMLERGAVVVEARFPFLPQRGGALWPLVRRTGVTLTLFLLLAGPLVWMLLASTAQSLYGVYVLFSGSDDLGLSPAVDVERVAQYLNERVDGQDVVLASPQVVWAVHARQTEWAVMLFAEGKDSGYPQNFSSERFAYDSHLQQVTYAVVDPLARNFAVKILPDLEDVLDEIEGWPLVYRSGEIAVYQNPVHEGR